MPFLICTLAVLVLLTKSARWSGVLPLPNDVQGPERSRAVASILDTAFGGKRTAAKFNGRVDHARRHWPDNSSVFSIVRMRLHSAALTSAVCRFLSLLRGPTLLSCWVESRHPTSAVGVGV